MRNVNHMRNWFIKRSTDNPVGTSNDHFTASAPSLFYPFDKWSSGNQFSLVESNNLPCKNLVNVAKLSHRKQKFDSSIWRNISKRLESTYSQITPKQLVVLLHTFKQIKHFNDESFLKCVDGLNGKIQDLDLYHLSLISLTFRHNNPPSWLISQISSHNIEKLNPDQLTSDFESITHILGSFSIISCTNQQLFQCSAESLIKLIEKIKLIPGHYIHKLIISYSRLSFSHTRLFDVLSDQILSCKLSRKELLDIKIGFESVQYINPKVLRFIAYRNVISNTN